MKRPDPKDYRKGHPQMDSGTELARYSEDQDKYIDWLLDEEISYLESCKRLGCAP